MEAEELAEIVRSAARGEAVLNPQVAARVVDEMRAPAAADEPNPFLVLSDRELQVLELVAGGLSNAEISERLCVTVKTVRTHVSNILGKLHLRDRTQAAVYAWREGVVRKEE